MATKICAFIAVFNVVVFALLIQRYLKEDKQLEGGLLICPDERGSASGFFRITSDWYKAYKYYYQNGLLHFQFIENSEEEYFQLPEYVDKIQIKSKINGKLEICARN